MTNNINIMIEEFYKTFYRIEELELKRDIKCLTINEFHIIDTINQNSLTMNELADKLGVTMGTATTTADNLVKKNFIKRERNQEDRRKVYVTLTNKGLLALKSHKDFHGKMIKLITKDLSQKELEKFSDIFGRLHENLREALQISQPQKLFDFSENQELKITDILGSRGMKDFFFKENIRTGTILKIVRKNSEGLTLLIEKNKVEIDKKDSYNILAVPFHKGCD